MYENIETVGVFTLFSAPSLKYSLPWIPSRGKP